MQKKFIAAAVVLFLLTIAAIVALHPMRANGENSNSQTVNVSVDNFSFTPNAVTVPVNSTVAWVNKDDIPHVIASNDGLFKSKALDTDQTFSYTFNKPGTYTYYCSIHPKMVGKIVVQ